MTSATSSTLTCQTFPVIVKPLHEEGKAILSDLSEWIKRSESQYKIGETVVREAQKLTAFIRYEHKALLDSNDEERLRALINQLSDLFAYMAEPNDNYINAYLWHNNLSRTPHLPREAAHLCNLFIPRAASSSDFLILYDEITQLRRTYVCRHLKHELTKEMDEQTTETIDLLSLTFFHVTRANILLNLEHTDLSLLPYGQLRDRGIVPFTGDFADWSTFENISCSTLDGLDFSLLQKPCVDESEKIIAQGIEIYNSIHVARPRVEAKDITNSDPLLRVGVNFQRYRVRRPEEFETAKSKLSFLVECMIEDIERCIKSAEPTQNGNQAWVDGVTRTRYCLQFVKESLTKPLVVIPDLTTKLAVDYPIVFASSTILTRAQEDDHMLRLSSTAAKLGTDIKVVFIPEEKMEHFKAFLVKHSLEAKVSVYNLEALTALKAMNIFVGPILRAFVTKDQLKPKQTPQPLPNE